MPIDELADLLMRRDVEIPDTRLLTGEVTDASVSPPLIQVGASDTAVACPCISSYSPTDGDFVIVLTAGATRVCLGRPDGAGRFAIPLDAGWTGANVFYHRIGNRVFIDGDFTKATGATGAAVSNLSSALPVGFRPVVNSFWIGLGDATTLQPLAFDCLTSGLLRYRGDISGSVAVGEIVRPYGMNWYVG